MNGHKSAYEKASQKLRYESLYDEISEYERQGIEVSVCGSYFPKEKSAEIMSVNEDDCYMADLITDDNGEVIRVNYDKVTVHK